MSQSLIIIPTYNERENVAEMINRVMALDISFDLLFVDDASPDGTAGVVKALMPKYPQQIHILERSGKLGLGTAYITGFKWALAHDYQFIFEMDCDFSHPLSALSRLYNAVAYEGYDVAVGSRYTKGGGIADWPFIRRCISYGASLYVRMVTWMPVKDPTAGFVCYRRAVLEQLDLDAIEFKGYAFQIEMKFAAYRLGYSIKEVPITFTNRQLGSSKMSSSIFGEAFGGVIKLRYRACRGLFPVVIGEKER